MGMWVSLPTSIVRNPTQKKQNDLDLRLMVWDWGFAVTQGPQDLLFLSVAKLHLPCSACLEGQGITEF